MLIRLFATASTAEGGFLLRLSTVVILSFVASTSSHLIVLNAVGVGSEKMRQYKTISLDWNCSVISVRSLLWTFKHCCAGTIPCCWNYTLFCLNALLLELCFVLFKWSSFVPFLALHFGCDGLEIACAVRALVDGNIWKLICSSIDADTLVCCPMVLGWWRGADFHVQWSFDYF